MQCCFHHFKLIEHFELKLHPVKSSENLGLYALLSTLNPLVQLFCQLSSLTIAYLNIVFHLSSLTFLFPMSANFRPHSHHTLLCIFHSSSFIHYTSSVTLVYKGFWTRLRLIIHASPLSKHST